MSVARMATAKPQGRVHAALELEIPNSTEAKENKNPFWGLKHFDFDCLGELGALVAIPGSKDFLCKFPLKTEKAPAREIPAGAFILT